MIYFILVSNTHKHVHAYMFMGIKRVDALNMSCNRFNFEQ